MGEKYNICTLHFEQPTQKELQATPSLESTNKKDNIQSKTSLRRSKQGVF